MDSIESVAKQFFVPISLNQMHFKDYEDQLLVMLSAYTGPKKNISAIASDYTFEIIPMPASDYCKKLAKIFQEY